MRIINSIVIKYNNLKLWQKILLAVSILAIAKILLGTGYINVNAESYTNPNVIMSDSINGANINVNDINSNNLYKSNWVLQDNIDYLEAYATSNTPVQIRDYYSYIKNSDNTMQETGYSDHYFTNNIVSSFENRTGQTGYYRGFKYFTNLAKIRPMKKNHYYNFLFEFNTNNVEWTSSSYTQQAFNITATYGKYNNSTSGTIDTGSNLLSITDISEFTVTVPGMTYTNPNYGYLLIQLHTPDLFYDSDTYDVYLMSLELRLINTSYSVNDVVDMDNYNYLFKSTTNGGYKLTKIYMMQDVDIFVGDSDYISTMGGTYLNQTQYLTCDTLDLNCHIQNILIGIKSFTNNLIFNIRQLFNYLFIPDFQAIQDRVDNFQEIIDLKYPDIQGLIDYKDYFFERASNISPQHTISFSGASLPGYNINIIPAFTFDFDTIINDSTFNPIYLVLRSLFIVIISISYCLFVFRIFSKMFNKEG